MEHADLAEGTYTADGDWNHESEHTMTVDELITYLQIAKTNPEVQSLRLVVGYRYDAEQV